MTAANGRANGSAIHSPSEQAAQTSVPPAVMGRPTGPQFSPEQIKELIAELEVPFHPEVIEWRVTNTTKTGKPRGQVIPYADPRAYTDRLNSLFTPAGWTRKYSVHTSANFERSKDQKMVAKVFVTCELTVFGLGSHSSTGEEWADNDNAGTSAEAQAFKRACACFGLGRYLYYFGGVWVDLDERRGPKRTLKLFGWATPEGWRQGLRPGQQEKNSPQHGVKPKGEEEPEHGNAAIRTNLVSQIEAMAALLGKGLYRGLLKKVARVWNPEQIRDGEVLKKLLDHMQAAERGLRRLETSLDKIGLEPLVPILRSLKLNSLEEVDSLHTLREIVVAMETKAGCVNHP